MDLDSGNQAMLHFLHYLTYPYVDLTQSLDFLTRLDG